MRNLTTISLKKDTKQKLVDLGKFGQTYDSIILELIKKGEEKS